MNNEQRMSNDNDTMNISQQIEYQYPSTDDLTRTNQLLTSTFHSKDSALGLSDDQLNQTQEHKGKSHVILISTERSLSLRSKIEIVGLI
jgi:hypothetical protein